MQKNIPAARPSLRSGFALVPLMALFGLASALAATMAPSRAQLAAASEPSWLTYFLGGGCPAGESFDAYHCVSPQTDASSDSESVSTSVPMAQASESGNLLKHPFFDAGFARSWGRFGVSSSGSLTNWSSKALSADAGVVTAGTSYLAINCAAPASGACGASQGIYQDLPVSGLQSGTYRFGIQVRSESAGGRIGVALQEINGKGSVVAQKTVYGTFGDGSFITVEQTASLQIVAGAVKLRFLIDPTLSPATFDLTHAWLMAVSSNSPVVAVSCPVGDSVASDGSCSTVVPGATPVKCDMGLSLGTDGSCHATQPNPTPAQHSMAIAAAPTSVQYGGSATVSWQAGGYSSCTLSGPSNFTQSSLVGTLATGALTNSTTYTLTCGDDSKSVTVAVSGGAAPAPGAQCGVLSAGASLSAGQSVASCDGAYTLTFQGDGNVVLYGAGSKPLWATNTDKRPSDGVFTMQGDGNLVLYARNRTVLWASGSSGSGASLAVQKDGNLVIYDANRKVLWASNTGVVAPSPCGVLSSGASLSAGQSVASCDGAYTLTFQGDGNVVLYGAGSKPLWATNTGGKAASHLTMQSDGNLVLYGTDAKPLWASNSSGSSASLAVQEDGNLVIYDANRKVVWASNTGAGAAQPPSSPTDHGGQDVGSLNASDPMTWLVQSVCVDSSSKVLPVDPYGGCPTGASIRKLQPGDPFGYNNWDAGGTQYLNSFSVKDQGGATYAISATDYPPANEYNSSGYSDGYDIDVFKDGWVSGAYTDDGGGYNQTFFGPNCSIGGGWLVFPTTNFMAGGTASAAITDSYWEQNGQNFPGTCSMGFGSAQDQWELVPSFAFGGFDGKPSKSMEAMKTYHGFEPNNPPGGGMEVNYYTREYGRTRWEAWVPASRNPTPSNNCGGDDNRTYKGYSFVVADCHDWSDTRIASAEQFPVIPLPNLNLLQHAHFDAGYAASWTRGGKSKAGNAFNWSRSVSATPRDKVYGTGVDYLAINCGASGSADACDGFNEMAYQDLPASDFTSGNTYGFGVAARSESGNGQLAVSIQQLDASGNVLDSDSVTGTLAPYNGDPSQKPSNAGSSVYLSAGSIYKLTTINLKPGATKVRFLISPVDSNTFDIMSAWFGPWPAPGTFGSLPQGASNAGAINAISSAAARVWQWIVGLF